MKVDDVIRATVQSTINELKRANLIKEPSNAYYSTIELLLSYKDLKTSAELSGVKTATQEVLDKAIESMSDEPYINIVKLYYIDGHTMEETAELCNIHLTGAYANRKRLVKRLSIILFGDEAIQK